MRRECSAPSALGGFRVSFSLFHSRTPLVLSHERSATVLLMMREEHHPPIKRARVEHGGGGSMADSSLPTFPLRFFLPRYLRLPDICTRHAAEARPSHVREREKVGTLICRAFCARENARRVLIAAWLSRTIYSPIRWKRIYHSFPFAFFPSSPLFPLSFSLSPLTDSACTTRERPHTNLHENVATNL